MNSVVLIGRLAKDPDIRYAQSGTAVCRITVAVDRPPRQGEEKKADFIQVVSFGKTAVNIERYLSKGRQAAVHGRIQTSSYTNRNGENRSVTEVIADMVEFIDHREKNAQRAEYDESEEYQQQNRIADSRNRGMQMSMQTDLYDDDLPDAFAATDDDEPF